MNKKVIFAALFLAVTLGGISGFIGARFATEDVTAYHLAQAQEITPFLVRLPQDLSEHDKVLLELVGEDGVIDFSRIHGHEGLATREPVKVFVFDQKDDGYSFSIVTTRYATAGHTLDLQSARMKMWAGSPHKTIHRPDEIFAFFSDDFPVREDLSENTLGLRLTVRRHEQDAVGNE